MTASAPAWAAAARALAGRRAAIGVVLFLSPMLGIGISQYAFGVYVTELETDLGWSRSEITFAVSFFAAVGAVSPLVGWLLDRRGARPVMAVSVAMFAASQLPRPWMTEVWQFYALNALAFAALPGAFVITAGRLVAAWYGAKQGRAMGMTAMGANVGGLVFAPLTSVLIGAIGWRASYFAYGLLYVAFLPLVLAVVRDRPAPAAGEGEEGAAAAAASGVGATLAEALRSRAFWLVLAALPLATMTYGSVLPQIVPHLELVGAPRQEAAWALGLFAVFGACGKVSFGWMTERRPARYVIAASLGCQAAGLWMLLAAGSSAATWLALPVLGLGFGALGALMQLLVLETFGPRAYGSIFGLVNFATLGTAVAGPLFVGATFAATGSYATGFLAMSGVFVAAAAVSVFARPHPRARAR